MQNVHWELFITILTLLPGMHLCHRKELLHRSCEQWYLHKKRRHCYMRSRWWPAQWPDVEWCWQSLLPEKQKKKESYFYNMYKHESHTSVWGSEIFRKKANIKNQLAFWFRNVKDWREGKCCEERYRLHVQQLKLEFVWLLDCQIWGNHHL
jgi:hypothetical protein